jgi:large conductance mechanosensitive channel
MEKRKGFIKRFFGEFKKFITRGNVLDMSVGIVVGGAFTAIVNGLSNFVLKPLVNWLIAEKGGDNGLEGAVTILGTPAYLEDGTVDLANTIYIDWGAFISSIINFLIIAFALFLIIKIINGVAEAQARALEGLELSEKKAIAKIRIEQRVSKKQARAIYEAQEAELKAKKQAENEAAVAKAAAEAKAAEEKAMANTRLLEEIRDLLKKQVGKS